VVEAKSSMCPGSDSNGHFPNTNLEHLEVHQPSLFVYGFGADQLGDAVCTASYGASDVSVTVYGEMKRLNCKGSGRGLFSTRISVFARKVRESPRKRTDDRKIN
jgi:hypothetical protein